MRPAMTLALLACLAVTGYLALQPDPTDDLAAPAPASRAREDRRPTAAAASGGPARPTTPPDRRLLLPVALAEWQASRTRPALPDPDVLSRQAWASQQPPPPPPEQTVMTEPSAPTAPPFPHAWVGRYLDPLPKAIIAGPMGTWVTAVGEVLEGQWRVDAIDDRQMTLTYLPLGQSQTVDMK